MDRVSPADAAAFDSVLCALQPLIPNIARLRAVVALGGTTGLTIGGDFEKIWVRWKGEVLFTFESEDMAEMVHVADALCRVIGAVSDDPPGD